MGTQGIGKEKKKDCLRVKPAVNVGQWECCIEKGDDSEGREEQLTFLFNAVTSVATRDRPRTTDFPL